MAARRLEAAAPANEQHAFAALFFLHSSQLRDRSTSGYQSVTLAKSFLSGWSWTLRYDQESENKDKVAHKKWGQFMETKTGLRSSTDRSWVVLVRLFKRFNNNSKTRYLSGAVAYFTTQYNVHNDNRQAGHLLSALRLERCTAAINFPHNKMAQKITE